MTNPLLQTVASSDFTVSGQGIKVKKVDVYYDADDMTPRGLMFTVQRLDRDGGWTGEPVVNKIGDTSDYHVKQTFLYNYSDITVNRYLMGFNFKCFKDSSSDVCRELKVFTQVQQISAAELAFPNAELIHSF